MRFGCRKFLSNSVPKCHKNLNKRPASFKHPPPISTRGKFQKLNEVPYPKRHLL